jgi:NarL family two-component system response regulator LiaR
MVDNTQGAQEKIRVMIIEDHDLVRQGLIVLLENFDDFEIVASVNNGRVGVDAAKHHQPDVVLLDMVMPEMDGVTAAGLIRESCPNTQVIALTSFSDEQTIQNVLRAGAISYLMKNVSVEELASAVRKARQGHPTLAPEAARALISASARPPEIGHDLTEREREVLALMIEGLNNREIAERLYISGSTVKNHVSSILSKLGTTSRTQAVAMAVEKRIAVSR